MDPDLRPLLFWRIAAAALLSLAVSARAADLHVRPAGADAGSATGTGSAGDPFTALEAACAALRPGDTLWFAGGRYRLDAPLRVQIKGTREAPITLRAAKGAVPILDGSAWTPPQERRRARGNLGLLHLASSSYVTVDGLRIENANLAGIYVDRGCLGIRIERCATHRTFGPGIAAWNARDVSVIACDVSAANDPSLRLPGEERIRENPHEAISIAGVDGFEVAWCHVHHSVKEGIDVKEVSRNGTVHHNWVHDVHRQGLYADAWFGVLQDVAFHHNIVHDAAWGMVIGAEGGGSELRRVMVHDNWFFRTKASGIYLGTWGGDGPRSGVLIAHNSLHANGTPGHWAGPVGSIDLRSRNASVITVVNNTMEAGHAFAIATGRPPGPDGSGLAAHGYFAAGDVAVAAPQVPSTSVTYGQPHAWPGAVVLVPAIGFRDAAAGDLRLRDDAQSIGHQVPLPGLDRPAHLAGMPGADPALVDLPAQVRARLGPAATPPADG